MRLLIALVALVVCVTALNPERIHPKPVIRPPWKKPQIHDNGLPNGFKADIKGMIEKLGGWANWLKKHFDKMEWEQFNQILKEKEWTVEDAITHFDELPDWVFDKLVTPLESRRAARAARAFENFENFETLFGSQDWDDFRNWAKDLKGGWKEAWNAWLGSEQKVLWENFLFENEFTEDELLNQFDFESSFAPAWMGLWFNFLARNQQNSNFY